MERFGFTRMFTSIASFRCRTVEIPEDAMGGGKGEKERRYIQVYGNTLVENTYHHQEWRKPGGSPRVMFFSHRI